MTDRNIGHDATEPALHASLRPITKQPPGFTSIAALICACIALVLSIIGTSTAHQASASVARINGNTTQIAVGAEKTKGIDERLRSIESQDLPSRMTLSEERYRMLIAVGMANLNATRKLDQRSPVTLQDVVREASKDIP